MPRSLVTLLTLLPAFAASAAAEGGHHGVDPAAKPIIFEKESFFSFVTNSIFVALLVSVLIIWFFRSAMKKPQMVPGKRQNMVEAIVEFLYVQTENILGPKVTKRAFPLLATIFIFVTIANWFGLVPGVGTIGFTSHPIEEGFSTGHIDTPLLRPATADMNLTLGVALFSFIIWFYITIREVGFKHFIVHMFGPKGGMKGFMGVMLVFVFPVCGTYRSGVHRGPSGDAFSPALWERLCGGEPAARHGRPGRLLRSDRVAQVHLLRPAPAALLFPRNPRGSSPGGWCSPS